MSAQSFTHLPAVGDVVGSKRDHVVTYVASDGSGFESAWFDHPRFDTDQSSDGYFARRARAERVAR